MFHKCFIEETWGYRSTELFKVEDNVANDIMTVLFFETQFEAK